MFTFKPPFPCPAQIALLIPMPPSTSGGRATKNPCKRVRLAQQNSAEIHRLGKKQNAVNGVQLEAKGREVEQADINFYAQNPS